MTTIKTTRYGEPIGGDSPDITLTSKERSFHIELGPHDPESGSAKLEIMIEYHGPDSVVGPGWKLYLYGIDEEPVRIGLDDEGRLTIATPASPNY